MPNYNSPLLYDFMKFMFKVGFKLIWRVEIIGSEHIPKTGPVIIAPNHKSYADPPVVGVCVPRRAHFMARRSLFKFKPFGYIIRRLNAHPISRAGGAEIIKIAESCLKNGQVVILFPEGKRIRNKEFGEAKGGVGLISLRSGAKVVPAYVHNSDKLKSLKKMAVVFGAPLSPEDYSNKETFAEDILHQIKKLKNAYLAN